MGFVKVNHGGCDVGVAQHGLHLLDRCAVVDVLVIGAIGVVAFACVSTIGDDYPQTQKLVGLVMTIGLGAAWGYYLAVEQKYGFGNVGVGRCQSPYH